MDREQAHAILMKYMEGENYITHSYAVEAIMRGLAKRLAPDEVEYWGIVGLLHDLDEEQCDWRNDMSVHGPTSVEILKKEGIEDKVLFDAICAHNPKSGVKAKTKLQYAILSADPMSGFVKAVAQIYPDKKIASVKHKSVMKRFNERRFAAGANRDYMEAIEFTGLSLDDLIDAISKTLVRAVHHVVQGLLLLSRGGLDGAVAIRMGLQVLLNRNHATIVRSHAHFVIHYSYLH